MPLPTEAFFFRIYKDDLLCDAETFSSCSFIPRRNVDMSTISLHRLTLPWRTHFEMQIKPNCVFFAGIGRLIYFSQEALQK